MNNGRPKLPKFKLPSFAWLKLPKLPKWPKRNREPGSPRGPRRTGNNKLIWQWVGIICLAGFFAGSIALVGLIAWVRHELPPTDRLLDRNQAQTTTIYDRSGEHILYQIYGGEKRTFASLENINKNVINATISAEDRKFYTHKGISITGIIRGFFRNLVRKEGQNLQSGSTITQQFIKKAMFSDEQRYVRKAKEIILSFEMERTFSKDEILQLYLNEIPYGSVAYGIESAAQTFFGKSAKDVTISEAALLASLPKGPTLYSPYGDEDNIELLLGRQRYVINAMAEEGYITQAEKDEALADDIMAKIKPKREAIVAPHFVFYVKQLLATKYGDVKVEEGGLKVYTTLDFDKQVMAEKAITDNLALLEKWKAQSAALAAINAHNGDILAMVGSADYFNDNINGQFNSLLGRLQPGSSIKPIVYAAAFEKGYTPTTVVEDVKTEFSTSSVSYSPNNYNFKEHGPVTLKMALAGSLNIPAVKALYLTGFDKFEDFAERIGYTTFQDRSTYGLSLVLGGAVVKPLEHINAYNAFARDGIYHPTRAILKVVDRDGAILEEHDEKAEGKKAFDPQVARQINNIMSDNAARAYIFGEKNYLTLGDRPVAAKTGTTNDNKDAWTVGFTPSLVAGVWVGNPKREEMKAGADGSVVAAPIWNQFMRTALAGTPVETFKDPEPVVTNKPVLDGDIKPQAVYKIDKISGKLATENTPPEFVEERGYGAPHSILFFVDKDDPRGPQPTNPEKDPQFANWEKAYAEWAAKQTEGAVINVTDLPPTEYDDVHIPENAPTVSFVSPQEGAAINDRMFTPQVSAYGRRGINRIEYSFDGDVIGATGPFAATLTIPNRISKGFHTLTAKATDDVGNYASTSITVNVMAEPGAIGIEWKTPYNSQNISSSQFPYSIQLQLDDYKSIDSLTVTAVGSGGARTTIGTVERPPLPNLSLTWPTAPPSGRYDLSVTAVLIGGITRTEIITISVN